MSLQSSARFCIFVAALYAQYGSCVNLNTLRLVQVVYRHGDRSPMFAYPTDPYKDVEKYWPNGLGQLTTKGKDQQYDLGLYLRDRYDGFIDRIYEKKQIHVLSSDSDRTLMSAEANLAGLFPKLSNDLMSSGRGKARLNAKVDIQLVPIHTLELQTDKLLHMTAVCPRLSAAQEEYSRTSPILKKLRKENEDLLKYVQEKTGITIINDIFQFGRTSDALYCQQQHNLTLPSWANDTVMEKLRYLSAIQFSTSGGTTEIRRLYGGPLARRLMDNMKSQTRTTTNQPKMYMHSAHDDTLAALMSTFGVFYPQNPCYACMFTVELHQEESTGKYFVELFYRNSTEREPYPLQIAGCGSPCYLKHMQILMAPYIPINWEAECQRGALNLSQSKSAVVYDNTLATLLGFVAVIAIAATIWVTILYITSRRQARNNEPPGCDKGSYITIP